MRGVGLLVAAYLLTGCAGIADSYVTPESAARMAAAGGLAAKRAEVKRSCAEAGFPEGTRRYARCFTSHFKFEIALQKARALRHAERLTKTRGLCIERRTWEARRCIEI